MKLRAWTFKFPIPRQYRNKLAYIFELATTNSQYYELSDMLLSGLTATEISMVVHFLGITEQFLYAKKYLNPLRDLGPSMALFEAQKGCRIFMLGNDITDLMERIQLPATYCSGRIAKLEANGGIIPPPKTWVVSIPPAWQRGRSANSENPEGSFDPLTPPPEIKGIQWAGMTSVDLQTYQPQRETQYSKYMCTMGAFSFEIGWDDWYKDIQSKSTLPYIDIKDDPHTIRFSENDTAMEYKSDTYSGDRSMVLWKKKYSLPRNTMFTGRAVGDNGRDILDEVDFAFRFPFEHRTH